MSSNLNSNTMVTLLNTSTISGVVNLPLTTNIPFRSIMFKDFTGYTNSNSTISLSTVGTDTFENGSTSYILNSPNSFVSFYANTYTKQWNTLYTSEWWRTPAGSNVNMNSNAFDNTLYTQYLDLITGLSNYLFSFSNGIFCYYNSNVGYPTPIASDWWQFSAGGNINMNGNAIQNVNEIDVNYIYGNGMGSPVTFGANLDMGQNNITNINVVEANVLSIGYSGIGVPTVTNLQFINEFGSNYFVTYSYYGVGVPIPIASDWAYFPAKSNIDLSNNQISNIQVNYSNIFSNTSIVPSLIAASPQTFSGAIFNQALNLIPFTLTTTNSESNYLYFNKNQSIWKIHIILNGFISQADNLNIYFTLSNSSSGIEAPFIINTSNHTFDILTNNDNVTLSLNDTINLSDIIASSITPYTPISLNMYCLDKFGANFLNSNITTWTNPINLSDLIQGYAVAYGNNTWVVGGANSNGGCIATSYDNGNTWIGTDLSIYTSEIGSVAYGNGVWVLGCFFNLEHSILYSTDGTNFTPIYEVPSIFLVTLGIAYGNGIFVATGIPNFTVSSTASIAYSTDGMNWTPIASIPNGGYNVKYANGLFVVVGSDSTYGLVTSQDGIHWLQYNFSSNLACVAYGSGRWYAGDANSNLYYSTDNWYSYTTITGTPNFASLVFGDTFVGTDYFGNIYNSTDFGSNWSSVASFTNSANFVAYGNGVYMAVGNNSDSNCILTTNAINMLTYSLEPATIQSQNYVLPAPTIDWANTNYDVYGNLVISWFPVPNATSYKVFNSHNFRYINKYTTKATTILNKSLTGNFFTSDSGPIIGNSYFISSNDLLILDHNFTVFSYRNGVRSSFPSTQIWASNAIQLWPVQQCEYHGGINFFNFTSITARNLYTNQSMIILSNEWINGIYSPITSNSYQIPNIGTTTPISNK